MRALGAQAIEVRGEARAVLRGERGAAVLEALERPSGDVRGRRRAGRQRFRAAASGRKRALREHVDYLLILLRIVDCLEAPCAAGLVLAEAER